MMAAVSAKERNLACEVSLFEKNAGLGAKVIISGGGRCNVTTGIFDVKELVKNYPRGAKFLLSALFRFPPDIVIEWFEDHGVPIKMQKDLRAFPKSDNGKDVVSALEKAMKESGVNVYFKMPVNKIEKKDRFELTFNDGKKENFDAVILTTGGNSYLNTGSTGDGYAFAKAFGHKITPFAPSLSAFTVAETWIGELAGVSFDKAKLTLKTAEGAKIFERTGAFVFTHRGVSGPAVFALSSMSAYEKIDNENRANLTVDFSPDEKLNAFEERFFGLLQTNPQKFVLNFLDIFLPKSMCEIVATLSKVTKNAVVGGLSKIMRQNIIGLLKAFPLTISGRAGGEEFVTAGGVDLSEVNTNTMESKICPGLYFAGEILDVDGFTGGFNLQSAWATGALAGESAALSTLSLK